MRIRAFRLLTVLAGLGGLLVVSGGLGSGVSAHPRSSAALTGVMVPAKSHSLLPLRADTMDSLNWSGYVVNPASAVTGVSSTFKVPSAGLVPPGFAATWTGNGGFKTPDLIQAGVAEQSFPDNPVLGPQYFRLV
jgi:hypothetical protein